MGGRLLGREGRDEGEDGGLHIWIGWLGKRMRVYGNERKNERALSGSEHSTARARQARERIPESAGAQAQYIKDCPLHFTSPAVPPSATVIAVCRKYMIYPRSTAAAAATNRSPHP